MMIFKITFNCAGKISKHIKLKLYFLIMGINFCQHLRSENILLNWSYMYVHIITYLISVLQLQKCITINKGSFTNYVDKILAFFTTYPPPLTFYTLWKLTKTQHFWTTYPLPLVNVVCERSLRERSLMTSLVFWPFLTYLPTLSYSITSLFWGYLGPPYLP